MAEALGAPREGPSFLVGLLVCGRCGRRLLAAYGGKANHLRYTCMRATIDYGVPGQTPPRHPCHQWELKLTGSSRGKSPLGTRHFLPYTRSMYYML